MFFLLHLSLLWLVSGQADDIVSTQYGSIQGNIYDSYREFLGIPFATPPTGNLRWTYPTPPANYSVSPLPTQVWGAGCAQACNLPPLTCPEVVSEDCLTLNVYTPTVSSMEGKSLPVLAFLPGGRFEQGTAGCDLYWGGTWVNSSEVILVTISYRLGALGFLGSTTIPGNYGLQDQRMGLQWIQDNIVNFGGDPGRVTVFGQSAGGTSTAVHLTSSASKGLYSQAIIHSNPWSLPLHDPNSASLYARDFAIALGCTPDDLDCMRAQSMDDIIAASNKVHSQPNFTDPVAMFYPWTPIVDGNLVDGQPIEMFAQGEFNKVPIMLGNVEEEALLFIWELQLYKPAPLGEYEAALEVIFGKENTDVLLDYYPPTGIEDTDYRYVLNQLGSDLIFTCPNRVVAEAIVKYNPQQPLFLYRFDHVISFGEEAWGPDYFYCYDHVCHGTELVYVFNNAGYVDLNYTDQEQWLANGMMRSWSNFAYNGDPNKPSNPPSAFVYQSSDVDWPEYDSTTKLSMSWSTPTNFQSYQWRHDYCNMWDSGDYLNPKAPLTGSRRKAPKKTEL